MYNVQQQQQQFQHSFNSLNSNIKSEAPAPIMATGDSSFTGKREESSDSPAQTTNNADMNTANYVTTPTPSYKQIINHKEAGYYQQQQQQPSHDINDKQQQQNTIMVNNNGNNNGEDTALLVEDEMQQRQMQQIFDKKRKRRESHNAVERRRRDNINERILELSTLLPERDASKNNKGTILRKSVDHIRLLHERVGQYQQRVQELENMLNLYRMRWGDLDTASSGLDLSSLQQQQQHSQY